MHMGIGCGQLTSIHVGGVFKRWEYVVAGPPMAQLAVAEPLALPGETVLSPEAWYDWIGCGTACLCGWADGVFLWLFGGGDGAPASLCRQRWVLAGLLDR